MKEKFINYIHQHKLFSKKDKILLGVSGGMDSVAMCELFFIAGFDFGIAHCNFQLRAEESAEDEKFVKQLALKYNVPFFCIQFQTSKVAASSKVSTQMAARKLRYDWFEKIRMEHKYSHVAVAHHSDDDVETFFINLLRGTGLAGLAGINPKRGYLVRPLLFASRNEIEQFIHSGNLIYREDSSNSSSKYIRNKVRHNLIPLMKQINPSITKTVKDEIYRLKQANQIFMQAIEEKKRKLLFKSATDASYSLAIDELKKLDPLQTWLYEFLSPFNFNIESVNEIISAFDSISGKQFFSSSHRIVKDREFLIISPIPQIKPVEATLIEEHTQKIDSPFNIEFIKIKKNDAFKIIAKPEIAFLDLAKIEFPLQIRKWKLGDKFIPLGMTGYKKISDFLIDLKISVIDKEQVYVLQSGNDIAWIIGHRLDNRFKISKETEQVYQAEVKKTH
ncbi:MAG: tRNA lysidine(34) synthetase TilS [Bacteroidetes bacterium]|nr:tRNA lysidine(34) synthetase TilS [Bacteroidota bacterium]HET6244149.1 tRNA lysidine(34) synthetase TilS [Bacteroidia bacterium]